MMVTPAAPGASLIELEHRTRVCVVPRCGGAVFRHSLGAGQAVDRCVRCFRRYETVHAAAESPAGRLRRVLNEIVSWRE
jgi:hypothetical protein